MGKMEKNIYQMKLFKSKLSEAGMNIYSCGCKKIMVDGVLNAKCHACGQDFRLEEKINTLFFNLNKDRNAVNIQAQ